MSVQLPRTPPNQTLELPDITASNQSTPYSKGIGSSSHLNDLRRDKIAQWLVYDVSKTANASTLAMLAVFTQRIMPFDSKEVPKDVLERILTKIRSTCCATKPNPKGTSSTRKRAKQQIANKDKVDSDKPIDPSDAMKERMMRAHKEFHKSGVESETYVPFVTMTNTALNLLKGMQVDVTTPHNATYDILLQHKSDPSLLFYKFNSEIHRQKPDNIFVTLHTSRILHDEPTATWIDIVTKYASTARRKANKPQPCTRLDWGDALCSIEHKRTGPIARKSPRHLEESSLSPLMDLSDKEQRGS